MPFKDKFIISQNLIPKPSRRRSGQLISKVRFLVAHDTGNKNSRAIQNVRYYINSLNETSASAHLFVDDKEIIECVPALTVAPEKAWHVLYNVPKDNELYGVNANDAAIGVEYCYGDLIDADKAYEKYVWVLAKLCYVFGLDASKDITGHFFLDPKRKTDPVTGLAYSRRTYDRLLKDVAKEYNECTGGASLFPALNITARQGNVSSTVKLNVRKEPNTTSGIVQTISARTVVGFKAIVQNGQPINNNPVWYQDVNDCYLWSGGVEEIASGAPAPISATQPITSSTTRVQSSTASSSTTTEMAPGQNCIDFIKQREGLFLKAYTDSAGIWTIGYGTIVYDNNIPVKQGDEITHQRAEEMLAWEIKQKAKAVNAAIKPAMLSQNQYDALVSFAYNTGIEALRNSTLLKRIKANPSDTAITDAFMMWDKAHVDGKLVVIKGLENRRTDEANLYFS